MPSRREVLTAIVSGSIGAGAAYAYSERTSEALRQQAPTDGGASGQPYSPDLIYATSDNGWRLNVGSELRFAESIGVANSGRQSQGLRVPDEHFVTVETETGSLFALVYAAGWPYTIDEPTGSAPPLDEWSMDVWVATERYRPRLLEHPEAKWYRIPGVDADVSTYPNSAVNGGYLAFEVERTQTGGTHSLLYGAPGSEFTLDYAGIDAVFEWLVQRDERTEYPSLTESGRRA